MTTETPATQTLPPCPFCGGEAQWKEDTGAFDEPFGLVTDHHPTCFFAQGLAPEEAIITAWNTRTSSTASSVDPAQIGMIYGSAISAVESAASSVGADETRVALEGLSLAADEINGDIDLQVNGEHSDEVDVNGELFVTLSATKVDALNRAICVAQRLLKQSPPDASIPDTVAGQIVKLAKRKYHFQPSLESVLRKHTPTGTTGYDWDDREAFSQVISILQLIPALAASSHPASAGDEGLLERAAQTAYRICAETRHVTLGEKAATAIRALSTDKGEASRDA